MTKPVPADREMDEILAEIKKATTREELRRVKVVGLSALESIAANAAMKLKWAEIKKEADDEP